MSNLVLSFAAPELGEEVTAGIVARIQGYPDGDQSNPFFREVVIPASDGAGIDVSVRPGRYRIQAVLPSGSILQEERKIADGEMVSVIFRSPAQRSGLGWQDFEGSGSRSSADRRGDWRGTSVSKGSPRSGGAPAIEFYSTPGRTGWIWDGALLPPFPRMPNADIRVSPPQGDGNVQLLRIDLARQHDDNRNWAMLSYDDCIEIASIPLPWRLGSERMASVEMLLDRDPDTLRARTSLAVRDPKLGGLLAYLGRGNLGPARTIFNDLDYGSIVHEAIGQKRLNPLAACAAAYVGLAVFEPGERERWDSWLSNIMDWFPSIPDGAIVHARRIINRPNGPSELSEALVALKTAFEAGLPYFTAGLLLLRDSLVLFAPRDEEARLMLEEVSRAASRVDQTQVFTVLQYPKEVDR